MRYALSIDVDWQAGGDHAELLDHVRIADEAGVHSVWVSEAWGRDAFTLMTLLAESTQRIQIGSAIVNVYSRTPAVLAQHFATLDEISGGRMLIGLGASGAGVIEHFHGVQFTKPLRRLREYVEIISMLIASEPLRYEGEIFNLERGFTLKFQPVRSAIPIFIASLTPSSVRQTAEIADGWLPIWIPIRELPQAIKEFRRQARDVGRDAASLMVRAPGTIVITKDVEKARAAAAASLAFYVTRMGDFYYRHISRLGYRTEAETMRVAWEKDGSKAGAAGVTAELQQETTLVTDSIEEARERLVREAEAGVDIHSVRVQGGSLDDVQKTYEALMK